VRLDQIQIQELWELSEGVASTLPLLLKTLSGFYLVGDHGFFFFSTIVTRLENLKNLVCPNVLPLKSLDVGS
jgi:hypothetical protein